MVPMMTTSLCWTLTVEWMLTDLRLSLDVRFRRTRPVPVEWQRILVRIIRSNTCDQRNNIIQLQQRNSINSIRDYCLHVTEWERVLKRFTILS